jgi:hypothetical protein
MTRCRSVTMMGLCVLAMTAVPVAGAEPPPGVDVIDTYPVAQGHYSTDLHDYGWIFFKAPDGRACGMAPNGGSVGCDAVPADAPQGTTETVFSSWAPANYQHSDTATFTRDVDVLPEGQRLEIQGSSCAVGSQDTGYPGSVICKHGHGFVLAGTYGILW